MRDATAHGSPSHATARTCMKPLARGVCGAAVPDDAPIPLCLADLAAAWDYCNARIYKTRAEQVPQEDSVRYARHMELMDQGFAERKAIRDAFAADPEVDDPDSVVYYIRFADRIKIGFSRNLGNRLMALPHDELLTVEPGARGVEQRRHAQFAEYRISGEWFASAEPLLAHIEELKAKHVDGDGWKQSIREAFDALDPHRPVYTDDEVLRSSFGV